MARASSSRHPATFAIAVACVAGALAAFVASLVWPAATPTARAAPANGFVEVQVARLLDTRPGFATVDGRFAGSGPLRAGEHTTFDVRGRAGIPDGAVAVAVTVTVTEPTAAGFVTLSPCGVVPIASTVNYRAGQTVANSAISGLSADGRLCVHTMSPTHVVVDVTGAFDSGFVPVPSARLLDTRPGEPTADGAFAGGGLVPAGGVVELQVGGRSGVPVGAEAASLNITTTASTRPGYVTAYPCGQVPLASTVNHARGENRANSLVVPLNPSGRVCLFTLSPTHLVVDVSGYVPAGSPYTPVTPARLADTRVDGLSVDGACRAVGRVATGTSMSLQVAGRGGVPSTGVGAVVLNVVATNSKRPGFLTAHRPDVAVPNASMLNHVPGATVASSVIAPVDAQGRVSLFSNVGVHLVVDVVGWLPGASSAAAAEACAGTFADPTVRQPMQASWGIGLYPFGGCALIGQQFWCWYQTPISGRVGGSPSPQPFGGTVAELAGSGLVCALRTDGVVRCQRAFSIVDVQVPRPITDIIGLGSSSDFCGIDDLGGVWCWRVPADGSPVAHQVGLVSRAFGFLTESPFDGPVIVRTSDGQGHVLEGSTEGVRVVASSTEAAPGVPWVTVEAVGTHWSSGERCYVFVDGRTVCGRSGDLAPEHDVDVHGGGWILTSTGESIGIAYDERSRTYSATASVASGRVRPYPDAFCVQTMSADGRWCLPRPS